MLVLAVAMTWLLSAAGWAAVYLDNLDQPNDYDAQVTVGQWIASRFTTGTNAPAYRLDALTLGRIYASTPGGNFVVSIYSCVGTAGNELPRSLIGNLSGSVNPDPQDDYTYSTANSVASGWVYPSVKTYAWSSDQGSTWPTNGAMWPYRYEIEATGVPEPGAAFIPSAIALGHGTASSRLIQTAGSDLTRRCLREKALLREGFFWITAGSGGTLIAFSCATGYHHT